MTIRFESEEEHHDGTELDHPTQHFAFVRKQPVQAEKGHSSGRKGDIATRRSCCSIAGIASLARTDILVVRHSRSLLEQGYLVGRYCRIHRTVQGWEPNARLVHNGH